MEAWLNNFFDWVQIGWVYYSLLGLLAFLESLAFIGLLFPGSILIVFTGFLAANGKGDFVVLATVYAAGAFLGDMVSYLLGARAGNAILNRPWFKKREGLLRKAEAYFVSHGGKSVFIGRFIGFLRPFIPFIAGSARMKPLPFILFALVSGILWGIAYPGIGFICGASWQMVQVWSGRFSLLIFVLAGLFVANALFWRYLVPLFGRAGRTVGRQLAAGWKSFLATAPMRGFAQNHPRLWELIRRRFSLEHAGGLSLTIGFTVSLLFALLFAWFGRGSHPASPFIRLDQRVYDLVAVLHHPLTDAFFAAITYLGSGQVMALLGAFVLITLILSNRDFSAVVFVVGMAGGELLTIVVKAIFQRPRPLPYFTQLEPFGASFPSGHAFSALLFYGLVVYFLLGTIRNWHARLALVFTGSFFALLIGFSRILLGVHWLSDVLGGFALAALWLTFLITACETRFRYGGFLLRRGWRPFNLSTRLRLLILAPVAISCGVAIYSTVMPQLQTISLELAPRAIRDVATPLQPGALPKDLPLVIESPLGKPLRPLSMIVVSDEHTLLAHLKKAGWQTATGTGLKGFMRLLADIVHDRPITDGAIVPHLVEGRIQDMSFVQTGQDESDQLPRTLLIWNLGRRFPDGREAWGLLATRQLGVQHFFGMPIPVPLNDISVDRERDALAKVLNGNPHWQVAAPALPHNPDDAIRFASDGRVVITLLSPDNPPVKE